jgi:uncharacterized LabA/DUF88 family protein
MSSKVAILADGGHLIHRLSSIYRRFPTANEVINHCNGVMAKLNKLSKDNELFRIYYYDCPPYKEILRNPIDNSTIDFSQTPSAKQREVFLDELSLKPKVDFRKGELFYGGWKIEKEMIPKMKYVYDKIQKKERVQNSDLENLNEAFTVNLVQKRIDIMIGLDIAWLSTKRIVDKLILITADTDFVPAMKLARSEGIIMIINIIKNDSVNKNLIINADEIINYP